MIDFVSDDLHILSQRNGVCSVVSLIINPGKGAGTAPGSQTPKVVANANTANGNTNANNAGGTNALVQAAQSANAANTAQYYLPQLNVIHTWNTKRLLPNPLLSQYTPFVVFFLVDDVNADSAIGSGSDLDTANSVLYGAPTDSVAKTERNLANFKFSDSQSPGDEAVFTKYFTESLNDNVFRVARHKGIRARINGYNNGALLTLIPLSLKNSQITTPDAKGIFEVKTFEYEIDDINGWGKARIELESNDITQMFSFRSVQSRVFQNYNRYFAIFGWQGPSVENVKLSALQTQASKVVLGNNSISAELLDGTSYVFNLPSPFSRADGMLNTTYNEQDKCYEFDIDETDNGNRMSVMLYGVNPEFRFSYPKVTIGLQLSNAGHGFQYATNLATFGTGVLMDGARQMVIDKLNTEILPIAYFHIESIFNGTANFDAEEQRNTAEVFYNNINVSLNKTGGLLEGLNTGGIDVGTPPPPPPPLTQTPVATTTTSNTSGGGGGFNILTNAGLASLEHLRDAFGEQEGGMYGVDYGYPSPQLHIYDSTKNEVDKGGPYGRYQFIKTTLDQYLKGGDPFQKNSAPFSLGYFLSNHAAEDVMMEASILDNVAPAQQKGLSEADQVVYVAFAHYGGKTAAAQLLAGTRNLDVIPNPSKNKLTYRLYASSLLAKYNNLNGSNFVSKILNPTNSTSTQPTSNTGFTQSFRTALEAFIKHLINGGGSDPTTKLVAKKVEDNNYYEHVDSFGFRSYQQQEDLYQKYLKGGAAAFNPNGPTTSKHMQGLAVDLPIGQHSGVSPGVRSDFINSAVQFNLKFPYKLTEPWHCEYDTGKTDPATVVEVDAPDGTVVTSSQAQIQQQQANLKLKPATTQYVQQSKITKVPAAYRLGDVVTACLEIIDELIADQTNNGGTTVGGIIDTLNKLGVTELEYTIGNKPVKKQVKSLTQADVYGTGNKKTKPFLDAVAKLKQTGVNSADDAFALQGLAKDGVMTNMAEALGYQVLVGQERQEDFKRLLNHFMEMSGGMKLKELKSKIPNKASQLDGAITAHLFEWDNNYRQSFSPVNSQPIAPITVGDLPISVDTASRILQQMVFNKTPDDLVNTVINAVSIDYGFSIRVIHVTPGSLSPAIMQDIETDYQNPRRNGVKKPTSPNLNRITMIMDDQFLTEEYTQKAIAQQLSNNLNPGATGPTSYKNLPNQSILQANLRPSEYVIPQNPAQSVAGQINALNEEYNSRKLNSVFIVDYASINSLVKSMSLSKIDGNTLSNQQAITALSKELDGSVNGDVFNSLQPKDKQDIIQNLSSINAKISDVLITKYKLLPGRQEYELKYTKLITQLFEDLTDDKSNPNADFQAEIPGLKAQLLATFKGDKAARREFVGELVSNYLYNRPMGIKYNFYFGRLNATIHGTTGLGFTQGIYARGIIANMDGIYLISKITHRVDERGFETSLDAVLTSSAIQLETQKALSKIAGTVPAGSPAASNNATQAVPGGVTNTSVPQTPPTNIVVTATRTLPAGVAAPNHP